MELQEQPLVTVYIPTFNRCELLKRAVESVRNQTYKNLEIIIVDDCSTDGTQDYLCNLAKEDKRVRFFLKEKNSGACISRNIAINNATGKYITGLDDDDYFKKDRIKEFINTISDNKKILCTNYLITNKKVTYERRKSKEYLELSDLKKSNLVGNQIFCPTYYIRDLGAFDENLPAWQDYDMWLRMVIEYGKIHVVNECNYIMDTSHDKERITTSSKAYSGYKIFIEKYSSILSKKDKKHLSLMDKINRNEEISINYLLSYFCKDCLMHYLKMKIKIYFPNGYVFLLNLLK